MRQVRPAMKQYLAEFERTQDMNIIDKAVKEAYAISKFPVPEVWKMERVKYVETEKRRLNQLFIALVRNSPHDFFEEYEDAVAKADDIRLVTEDANKARQFLATARHDRKVVDDASIIQSKELDEKKMKEILKKADDIKYNSEPVQQLRNLLYNTAEDKFRLLQLNAARQTTDHQRIIATTIRLKELFFETAKDFYLFPRFPGLQAPTLWAELKFVSLDRRALATGMYKWNENIIHEPLTNMKDSVIGEVAVTMFKNVMAYMGDRPYASPDLLAQELIRNCLSQPALVDEVYCQVMKQLSDNPRPDSVRRGWGLMMLLLDSVPPNESVDYVEYFVRTKANPPTEYVKCLHQTLHGGRRNAPPTLEEMQHLAGGKVSNRLGYAVGLERPNWEGKQAERKQPPPLPALPSDKLQDRACMVCRQDCLIM